MAWDPTQYLRFANHRARPGLELIARIPDVGASEIVDLGCGTGNLTAMLADRWPEASVRGLDSSDSMIERARADHPGIDFTVEDIEGWEPSSAVDVLYSNATLHWLDDHSVLFPRLFGYVATGGVMAVQMPDNWQAPTHRVPADVLDGGGWPEAASAALMRDRLASVDDYAVWLTGAEVDMWRTTYYQRLEGPDPVWEWVTGSLLRPVLAELDGEDAARFEALCKERYRSAYPPGSDGITSLAFSRLFIVARKP